jgi:hypothetical protein
VRAEMIPFRALTALANSLRETILRILGTLAAVVLFTTVARADCVGDCNRGYNGCKRNCAGVSMCEEGCAHGRASCLRGCRRSQSFTPVPPRTAAAAEQPPGSAATVVAGN